jgi:uncharacterized protein (TIGR00730 family)
MPTEHDVESEQRSALIEEIREEVDKLARYDTTRGDLKIIARALKELRYSFKVFTPLRRRRKVTVFGSARLREDHPAFQTSVEFGRQMAAEGWMIVTGAGGGIMEGAHIGAGRDMAIGLNIMLPFEQASNPIIAGHEHLIHLKYFFTRKLLFVKEVHAVTLCPGGFGTQDEGFEVLTLVQTGKRDLMPIVLLDEPGGTYWTQWRKFVEDELLHNGLISPEDMSLFKVTDDVDAAVDEILNFYSVYNSMRYVRSRLVIRLHREPSDALVERLNDEFGDIVEGGRIEKVPVHTLEADDEHLTDLSRIAFKFDRRGLGRLRQMVDLLNDELSDDNRT